MSKLCTLTITSARTDNRAKKKHCMPPVMHLHAYLSAKLCPHAQLLAGDGYNATGEDMHLFLFSVTNFHPPP